MPKDNSLTLVPSDYIHAAWFLDCDIASIQAIAAVEAPRGGYLPDGQVTILFERHLFHRLTDGRYSQSHPAISNPKPGGYTTNEHNRLQQATKLDRNAALMSASWGKFQILGSNWNRCGYSSLQHFITNIITGGEVEHLRAFCGFIRWDPRLHKALKDKDWSAFARRYNGPAYRKHKYDERMKEAYMKFKFPI